MTGRKGTVGREILFRRALAWRKLLVRLVELVKQSKRKDCVDMYVAAIMYIGKMAGCVVLPRIFVLQASAKTVCAE
jgi:hypothetical protein